MSISKVEYFGETLMDISDSTVQPDSLKSGTIAYDKKGDKIVGTYVGSQLNIFASASQPDFKNGLWIKHDGVKNIYTVYPDIGELSVQNLDILYPTTITMPLLLPYNGEIYGFGGIQTGGLGYDKVVKINPNTKQVTEEATITINEFILNGMVSDNYAVIVSNDYSRVVNPINLYQYDFSTKIFTLKSSDSKGILKRQTRAVAYNDFLYLPSGYYLTNVYSGNISKIDSKTFVYTISSPVDLGGTFLTTSATVCEDIIYFSYSHSPNAITMMVKFDPNTSIATRVDNYTPCPLYNSQQTSYSIDDKIYYFGGNYALEPDVNSSIFNTSTGKFESSPFKFRTISNGVSGVELGGKFYLVGGAEYKDAPWSGSTQKTKEISVFDAGQKFEPDTAIVECGIGSKNVTILYEDEKIKMEQSINKVSIVDSDGVLQKANAAIIVNGVVTDIK